MNNRYFSFQKNLLKLSENPVCRYLPGKKIIDHTDVDSRPFKMEFYEKRRSIKSVLIIGSGPL